MSVTRNTKNVLYYTLGFGAFDTLGDLLAPRRESGGPVFFYVDHYFQDKDLVKRIPAKSGDQVVFVDTGREPSVEQVDALAGGAKAFLAGKTPACIVGLGGGSVLDIAKAVANLMTNPGKAEEYQGWDLVKNPAPYKIGVPTLSGTGSEYSRTCVLMNERRKLKLGMNSDFTVYDQLVLDPSLTRTVPREHYFYTGMDTFMHCFESIRGSYRNVIIDTLSHTAIGMCKDIFLGQKDMMAEENLEAMMVASYIGGMAAGNTGVVHPVSAGLAVTLHLPHGLANCLALSVLEDIYPEEHAMFTEMMARQKVSLPRGVCANLTEEQYRSLYEGSIIHEKPLTNALGPEYKAILTEENLLARFKRM